MIAAIAAALGFAVASVLKHRSAQAITVEAPTGRGRLGALVSRTLRHKVWLWAIVVDVVATGLHIVALHLGPLSVVQPVLGAAVLFALLMSARGRLRLQMWLWAAALVVSIVGLSRLVASSTTATAGADKLPAAIGGAAVLAISIACVTLAARVGASAVRAVLLGLGVGILYAVNAALLKAIAEVAVTHGFVGVVASWQFYVVLVSGAVGLMLNQAAFRAGSLQQALPAMSVADPLASIVIGIVIFDEPLSGGALGFVLFVAASGMLALATLRLASTSTESAEPSTPHAETEHTLTGQAGIRGFTPH